MFNGESDHIVFKVKSITLTRDFFERIVVLAPTMASEVNECFTKIKNSDYSQKPQKILGGSSHDGPYRFYVKDPAGYTLEFETWEEFSS